MLLNNQKKKQKISSTKDLYHEMKCIFEMRKTARFWFGSLLALTEQIQITQLNLNCSQAEKQNLLLMLNYAVSDMMGFYEKEPPQEVYHLLQIVQNIFRLNGIQEQEKNETYKIIMQKLHFYNVLGIFMIKNRQYNFAYECFQQIKRVYDFGKVENCSEIFLSVFNNYLCLMKTSNNYQNSNGDNLRLQIVTQLEKILLELCKKYQKSTADQKTVLLLLSVFRQNERLFKQQTKSLVYKILKKYSENQKTISIDSKQLHNQRDQSKIDSYLLKSTLSKNQSLKIAQIKIKQKQLGFYVSIGKSIARGSARFKQQRHLRQLPQKQQFQILSKSLRPNQQQNNKPSQLIKKTTISTQLASVTTRIMKPAPPILQEIELAVSHKLKQLENQKSMKIIQFLAEDIFEFIKKPITIKNSHILITYVSEGLILQNYLGEKQKFLTWQDTATLLQYFKMPAIFAECLPLHNNYQLSKIILQFLSRREPTQENRRTTALRDYPKQLISVNQFIKIYKQEGSFLKIFMMNHYDSEHVQLCIDCYIDDFSHFFKKIKANEYIQFLNSVILSQINKNKHQSSQFGQNQKGQKQQFSYEMYRKDKLITKTQILNQLKLEQLRNFQQLKNSCFQFLLIMKNQKRLLIYTDDKLFGKANSSTVKQQQLPLNINFKVIDLNQNAENNKNFTFTAQYYRFIRYFPLQKCESNAQSIRNFLTVHGKLFFQSFLHCFYDFPDSFFMSQNFVITTFSKKIEIIKQGRYYTPISAQLVGVKDKFLGIIFREFEQSQIRQVITFVYNQEHELLAELSSIKTEEQRKNILVKLLYKGKVKETLQIFKNKSKKGTMVGFFQYLDYVSQYKKDEK